MNKQLTPAPKAGRDQYLHYYDNQNAHDLVLIHIGSQRPKTGQLKLDAEDGFMIHTLKPSYRDPITGKITNLQATHEFNLDLPVPEVPPEDVPDMEKFWRSLATGTPDRRLWRYEARKYMKFSKLKPVSHIFKKGLKLGKRYISEDGDMNLMNILKNKGYKVGNFYPCHQLLKDIESVIGEGGIDIDFGTIPPIKNQVLEDVGFLNQVWILHDKEAENRIKEPRPNNLGDRVFLLEDVNYRFAK